jgi:hypothetical protein
VPAYLLAGQNASQMENGAQNHSYLSRQVAVEPSEHEERLKQWIRRKGRKEKKRNDEGAGYLLAEIVCQRKINES